MTCPSETFRRSPLCRLHWGYRGTVWCPLLSDSCWTCWLEAESLVRALMSGEDVTSGWLGRFAMARRMTTLASRTLVSRSASEKMLERTGAPCSLAHASGIRPSLATCARLRLFRCGCLARSAQVQRVPRTVPLGSNITELLRPHLVPGFLVME